ncbi:MAG: polyphosphate polymerase domain-containing protein [Pirellulaceae bacterium]
MNATPPMDRRIELKYLLSEPLVQQVTGWAREHLGIDAHCCDRLVDSYDVHTLYLDSPNMDLYHRTGVAGSAKHRIRRYGHEPTVWLECKRKKNNVVRKHRTAVPDEQAFEQLSCRLPNEPENDRTWCGEWFAKRMADRGLQPAIQVHYRRFARTATLANESLRLTIDSQLQASRVEGWHDSLINSRSNNEVRRDAPTVHILELKFHNRMPKLFKELLTQFLIPASRFSKYRTAVNTWGLDAPRSFSTTGQSMSMPLNMQASNAAEGGEQLANV